MRSQTLELVEHDRCVEMNYHGTNQEFKKSVGWRYLLELLRHPGETYYARDLYASRNTVPEGMQMFAAMSAAELEGMNVYRQSPDNRIEKADLRCIAEVKKRLLKVIEMEAELRINNDVAALEEVLNEKDKLLSYLQEVLYKDGRIAKFLDAENKAREAVRKAISRCLDEIEAVEPELGRYLRKRIKRSGRLYYLPGDLDILV
ncbi:MAG: hypothetical protein PHO85_01425 [Candidatus Cloacimonetes bacterium]|nr:hypothetical protein [Candidatus Cloacimonadota bacterium]MDD4147161.1 hypothetical protein [Candidatus Cloacimonadota bacterium]MDD4560170.1 hypothetical protein [Candidatus Cloacimonadota bacterium]